MVTHAPSMSNNVPTQSSTDRPATLFTVREWLLVGAVILVVLVIAAVPYVFAYRSAPADRHFMGVMVNIPDHFQYFSWMREAQTQILVPNQLTPEDSTPLLFNFLWWTLGRIEVLTGLDYAALYQITRWLAGAFVMAATYFFCGVVFTNRLKRWTAFLIATIGGGLGWLLVVEKTLLGLADVNSPFALYTSEPNTFFNILAFPHFSIAAGLIAIIFGLMLLVVPVNIYLMGWRFIDLRRADYPFYVPTANIEALDYLETQVASNDVVLSSLDMGQYVPALTGARSFLGHWAQTLHFFDKQDMVKAFFTEGTAESEREAILRDYSVDYVLYTEREQALGTFDPASVAYLEEVYRNDNAVIYAVQLAETAMTN